MTPQRFAALLEGAVHDQQTVEFEAPDGAQYTLEVRIDRLKRRHVPDEGPEFEITEIFKTANGQRQPVDRASLDQKTFHEMEMHVHQELHRGVNQPGEYDPPVG